MTVPVLSKTTVSTLAKVSIKLLPLIRIPSFAAPPIPPKNPRGTDITRAQGQEITKKVHALIIHSRNPGPIPARGGIIARTRLRKQL